MWSQSFDQWKTSKFDFQRKFEIRVAKENVHKSKKYFKIKQKKLFVKGLKDVDTPESIFEFFHLYGKLESFCRIKYYKRDGTVSDCAEITFRNKKGPEKALEAQTMSDIIINGGVVKIEPCLLEEELVKRREMKAVCKIDNIEFEVNSKMSTGMSDLSLSKVNSTVKPLILDLKEYDLELKDFSEYDYFEGCSDKSKTEGSIRGKNKVLVV